METIHSTDGGLVGVAGDATDAAGFLTRFGALVDAGTPVEDAAEQAAQDD